MVVNAGFARRSHSIIIALYRGKQKYILFCNEVFVV